MYNNILLEIEDLTTKFPINGGFFGKKIGEFRAVNKANFKLYKGKTLGLVGESGSGKTTLGHSILRLIEPFEGKIKFKNRDIRKFNAEEMRTIRKEMQIIFQDPFSSLNPRMTINEILAESLIIHNICKSKYHMQKRIYELLEYVKLSKSSLNKYPHEFSGGQKQRINIARALAVEPEFIVCDESVSALDVTIQTQILNLLLELQNELDLTYLFISHNLKIVEMISHEVAVMYLGNIVEKGTAIEIYNNPKHPYTKALLSAIPDPYSETKKIVLEGDIPSPTEPPSGCHFHTRCWKATDICKEIYPDKSYIEREHMYRCYHPL